MSAHDKLAYRTATIVARLSMGETLHIPTLCQEFEVSKRTLYRDYERLSAYLPIIKNKDYLSLEQKSVGHFNFAELTQFAKLSGSKHIYPEWNLPFVNQLLEQNHQVYHIKTYAQQNTHTLQQTMLILQQAIENTIAVRFYYKDKERMVLPYRLVYRGVWYLAGVENKRLKTYHVSRIQHLTVSQNKFTPDTKIAEQVHNESDIWFVPSNEKIEVQLKIDKEVAMYFEQRSLFPNQTLLEKTQTGGLLLSSTVSHKMQIFPLVRFWIPHIQIVNPIAWQDELIDSLQNYIGQYQTSNQGA